MYKLEMHKKKEPRKKSSIDFTIEAFQQMQNFKKKMNLDASNSTIINELIMIFLDLPDALKELLFADCQRQIREQKQQYAAVTKQEEIEKIDEEIEKYNRLMAFLQQKK